MGSKGWHGCRCRWQQPACARPPMPPASPPAPATNSTTSNSTNLSSPPLFPPLPAAGQCMAIPASSMPSCPTIADHKYLVSASGLRAVHGDECEGMDAVIKDTDGKVRALVEPALALRKPRCAVVL